MLRTHPAARAIALALAFLLVLALVVIAEIGQAGQSVIGGIIDRSQQRQILLAGLLHDLAAAEAGQRAFLLTGDRKQLAPYRDARARIAPALEQLLNLLQRDTALLKSSDEAATVGQLRAQTGAELDALAASLTLYSSEGPQQALALIRLDLAKATMTAINDAAARLRANEQTLVNRQLSRAGRLRFDSRLLMGGVALLNVILLIAAAAMLARQAQRRAALTEQLARQNEELERGVRRRTAELSALSTHLQQVSEKEKATLARELHDELGGLLIAVKMDVAWLQKRWPNAAPEIQTRWERVLKVLDDGVNFKRRIVENLRPTLLDNMGLLPAVRWITQESCSRAGLQYTEIYPEHEPHLADHAAIMVFRLVQESLTNVVKHAHATQVLVQITLRGQDMSVLIEDNGIGIEPERRDAVGSHGLAIMRHRVRSYGGNLDIETGAQGGTRVQASLPLPAMLQPAAAGVASQPLAAGAKATAATVASDGQVGADEPGSEGKARAQAASANTAARAV